MVLMKFSAPFHPSYGLLHHKHLYYECISLKKQKQQLWVATQKHGSRKLEQYQGNSNLHRAGQRCFELLALIGSPQLSFQRYYQLNKHLGLTGKPYLLAQRQMVSRE